MKKIINEFKTFISRGNVFDMAVGLIIATAFNKIVSSLVNDIIMPLITWATGAASLADLSIPLKYSLNDVGEKVVTLSWAYGNFIQTIIDFFIIAISVFAMVKIVNASREKFKEFSEIVVKQTKKEARQERKQIRKQAKLEKRPFMEVWKEHAELKEKQQQQELEVAKLEKEKQMALEKVNNPTQEDLLKEIRDLLKKQVKDKK